MILDAVMFEILGDGRLIPINKMCVCTYMCVAPEVQPGSHQVMEHTVNRMDVFATPAKARSLFYGYIICECIK